MATYYSNKVLLNTAGQNTVLPKWLPEGDVAVWSYSVVLSGTTFASGDTIQLLDVPPNVITTGFTVDTGKIDGGGTPAVRFSIGDASNTGRYMLTSTLGQAGGVAVSNVAGGALGVTYSSTTRVYATITTSANGATTAAAVFGILLNYSADP